MGNSSSTNDNMDDKDTFIEEQKKLIKEQNEQIKKLSDMMDGNFLNEQNQNFFLHILSKINHLL